jgi:HK97 family phage major capsid protein
MIAMAYNKVIDRNDATALIPEEVSREIVQGVAETSACLRLFRRLPNMSRKQQRIPVLSVLPTAYFVNGDTGLKQTTEQAWENKYLNAEEIACIVPIPEAVLDDADYDIWAEVRPRIVEAFGVVIDAAILFGINAPASWPASILDGATSAGHVVALGTGADIYDDIMGENGVISLVEEDGYMVNGHIAAMTMKARLRGLRDSTGQPIFVRSMQDRTRYELDGEPMEFPANGAFDVTQALMFSGDFRQAVYAMRQEITYKVLTEAVIQDNTGAIVYNLAQQDMVALRAVMRLAWQVPNPVTRLQPTEAQRYPFAVLTPAAGAAG